MKVSQIGGKEYASQNSSIMVIIFFITSPIYAQTNDLQSPQEELHAQLTSSLIPVILEGIKKNYGEYRQYDCMKFLSIKQQKETEKIKLRIRTFVGPHNPPYGLDTLEITKDNKGFHVTKFSHKNLRDDEKVDCSM